MKFAFGTVAFLTLGISGAPLASGSKGPAQVARSPAPQGPLSVWDGVYTIAQAKRGAAHSERCAPCHGDFLEGAAAPPLVGPEFGNRWDGKTLGDIFEFIESNFAMLNAQPRSNEVAALNRRQSAEFLAFLLVQSRFPGGPTELPDSVDRLKQIRFQVSKP